MIYTPLIQKAMKFAYDAHHGQADQCGVPYVFHPFYVAEMVSGVMPDEVSVCVALLHDVIEDTDVTPEQLEQEFPGEISEIVLLLTHNAEDDYFDYVRNLKKNPVAVQVKAMDLYHNMDESRLAGVDSVTDEQKEWWHKKYSKALGILLGTEQGNDNVFLDKDGEEDLEVDASMASEVLSDGRLFMPMSNKEAYQRLDKLRKELLPHGTEIMVEHRFEVFAAIERMLRVLHVAYTQGLLPLEKEGRKLAESDSELEHFLAAGIKTEALETCSSMYDMFCAYDSSARSLWQDFIRYIYMRGVLMMTTGVNLRAARFMLVSLLPVEERKLFDKYQQS